MRLYYDFETNGLFADDIRPGTKNPTIIDRVHCLVTQDLGTGEMSAFHDNPAFLPHHGSLAFGVTKVLAADVRCGHNSLAYDERVLREFFPDQWAARSPKALVLDSMVGAKAAWPTEHLMRLDAARIAKARAMRKPEFPGNLVGRHSLESWGCRLGNRKAEFTGGFAVFTQEMLSYCIQDCSTGVTLFKKIEAKLPLQAWTLEQDFALEIRQQERNGFAFDVPAAERLAATLQGRRAEILAELAKTVPAFENHYVTPKRQIAKVKVVVFNPGSRHHIHRHLSERHGWRPTEFTDSGDAKVDETVLDSIKHLPGVPLLIEYLLVQKRLSQLAEGASKKSKPWLACVGPDGRVHGRVDHCGAVSGRCTHSSPNLSAVPKAGSPYGLECRALFTATPGRILVDGDVKALEPRFLGHYLFPFDGGAFSTRVCEGTLYEKVVELLAIPVGPLQRDTGKRTFLAWIYGAGKGKLGKILDADDTVGKRAGSRLSKGLQTSELQRQLRGIAERTGSVNLPDGRRAAVRSEHTALNTLLQGSGAVLVKQITVLANRKIREERLDAIQVGFFHDELVFDAAERDAARVGEVLKWATEEAARVFKLRCPMVMDVKTGSNWSKVH